MDFWRLIYHIDIILFIFVAATVLYLAVFALASLLNKHTDVPKAKKQNRFIIQQEIGIIRDAVGNSVDAFKEGKPSVIRTDPHQVAEDLFRTKHNDCVLHSCLHRHCTSFIEQ